MLKFTNYKLKYTPDQHTNNNKGLYMQPQTHCLHKILQRRTEFTVSFSDIEKKI